MNNVIQMLTSSNTLSGVTSERYPSPRLCAKAHTIKVATLASRWQRMGDLIGSGFEPHTSRIRSERLTTCHTLHLFFKPLLINFLLSAKLPHSSSPFLLLFFKFWRSFGLSFLLSNS